ncbi:MAG: hypothetical protein ABSH39_00630 [Candidatus Acidiferrum sp.]
MKLLLRFPLALLWRLVGMVVAFLLQPQLLSVATALPQQSRPQEDLRGILLRQPLKPPLRDASVTLRYGPDGHSLMVQNPSGLYMLSREPLRLRLHSLAEEVYPARSSFDSNEITIVGHGLTVDREKVPSGPGFERTLLPFHDGCLDAQLSPGADFFACLMPDLKLVVYQLSANRVIFTDSVPVTNSPYPIVHIPMDPEIAFPSPIGFRLANTWSSMAGKGVKFLPMDFSPDGKTLLLSGRPEGIHLDLTTGRKIPLPGSIHKRLTGSFCLQTDDRVLIAPGEKGEPAALMSLKSGEVLATFSFKADTVRTASNPRYALLTDTGKIGVRVFDLEQNRELDAPENLSVDIFGHEMAVLNDRGTVFLYRMGETLPFLSADLPIDGLYTLRAAAVTPALDRFAFSLEGSAALFQVASGAPIYSGPPFSAAFFSGPPSAFLLRREDPKNPQHVIQLDPGSGKIAEAWNARKGHLHPSGSVLIEYDPSTIVGRRFVINGENDVPYILRALDPASGKELWKREFTDSSPVSFADPQDDCFILAWDAKSLGAELAAKHSPAAWEIFKHTKVSNLDTYFEVLDARSGKDVGGALVQQGSGPYSFDGAFSVGDVLFLMKDGKRISVFSLKDSKLLSRFVGVIPAANASSNLFAFEEGPGLLVIHDLRTMAKLGQHIFQDSLAYFHFSGDGNRLFVLTKHQVAYILDVAAMRSASSSASP